MSPILRLKNPVRPYPWGSRSAIPELLGQPVPSPQPQAELWMGDHPLAPSQVAVEGHWIPLPEFLRTSSGPNQERLPFLLKILAAAEPLSIQAHPDAQQAERGCALEDAAGLPRDAPMRNYRDPCAKPELLFALEPFWLLSGFRPPKAVAELTERFDLGPHFEPCQDLLRAEPGTALEAFIRSFLTLPDADMMPLLDRVLQRALGFGEGDLEARWILRLAQAYPRDRGALAPLFLNLACLEPGEVLFTGPGVLHAYLEGVGVELMANSDNVLRGGLTGKHTDIPELLSILRFDVQSLGLVEAVEDGVERRFEAPDTGLRLGRLHLLPGVESVHAAEETPQILLCTRGQGLLSTAEKSSGVSFGRGDSFLITPGTPWRVSGDAELFRAAGSP